MSAWTQLFEPGPVLLLLIALLVPQTAVAAPFEHDTTEIEYYPVADSTGCYYNFQHYDEGDRIITNEPCLNCTCHNRMLMCYLRVCPFTKAIGQDCKVEKRPDQCCPVITCPEVPVQLLPSTTQSSTAVGHLDAYGCSIDSLFYADGARVPSDPNKPCELCYCIRNKTACVMQQCTLEVEGCKPVYQEGVCCPVRYNCEHPDYNLLETTTRRLITTTTLPTTTLAGPSDCFFENEVYADGALIRSDKRCERCYCMKGDIVCAVQKCNPTPLDKVNCTAMPPKEDQCCPDSYQCDYMIEEEPTTPTSNRLDDSTEQEAVEQENEITPQVAQETTVPSVGKEGEVGQEPITVEPSTSEKEQLPQLPEKEIPSDSGVTPHFDEAAHVTEGTVDETEKPIEQEQVTEQHEMPDQEINEIPEEHESITAGPHIPAHDDIEEPEESEDHEAGSGDGMKHHETTEADVGIKPTEAPSSQETEMPSEATQQPEHKPEEGESTGTPSVTEAEKVTESAIPHKPETESPYITTEKSEHGPVAEGTELPEKHVPEKEEDQATEPSVPELPPKSGFESTEKSTGTPHISVEDEHTTTSATEEDKTELTHGVGSTEHPHIIQQVTEMAPEIGTGLPHEMESATDAVEDVQQEQVTESDTEKGKEPEISQVPVTEEPAISATELPSAHVPKGEDEGKATESVKQETTEEPKGETEVPHKTDVESGTTFKPAVKPEDETSELPEFDVTGTEMPQQPIASDESTETHEESETLTEIPHKDLTPHAEFTTELPKHPVTGTPTKDEGTELPKEYATEVPDKEEGTELPTEGVEGTEMPKEHMTQKPIAESEGTELPKEEPTEMESTEQPKVHMTTPESTELPPKETTEEQVKDTEVPKEHATEIPALSDKETEAPVEDVTHAHVPEDTEVPKEHLPEVEKVTELPSIHGPAESTEHVPKATELPHEEMTVAPTEEKVTEMPEEKPKGTQPSDSQVTEEYVTSAPGEEGKVTEMPQSQVTVTEVEEGRTTEVIEHGTEVPKEHIPQHPIEPQVTEKQPSEKPDYVGDGKLDETTKYAEESTPVEGEIPEQHPVEHEHLPEHDQAEQEIPETETTDHPEQIETDKPSESTKKPSEIEIQVDVTKHPEYPTEWVTEQKEIDVTTAKYIPEKEVTEPSQQPSDTSAPETSEETTKESGITTAVPEKETTEVPHKPSKDVEPTEKSEEPKPGKESEVTTAKYFPEKEEGTESPQKPEEGVEHDVATEHVPMEEADATTSGQVPVKEEGTELPHKPSEGEEEKDTEKPQVSAEGVVTEIPLEDKTGEPHVTDVPQMLDEEHSGKPSATEETIGGATTVASVEKEETEGEVTDQATSKPTLHDDMEHLDEEEAAHGIPGEGSCLVDGQTYKNNSDVPPINHCQVACKCMSSILQCESVTCTPPPSNLQHCMPVYQGPDSCCPTYSCSIPGVTSMESDSHKMEITTTEKLPGEIDVNVIIPSEEGTVRPEGTTVSGRDSTDLPEFSLPEGHITPSEEQVPEHGTELPQEIPTDHVPSFTTGKPSEHITTETAPAVTESEIGKVTMPFAHETPETGKEPVTEKELEEPSGTTLKPVSETEYQSEIQFTTEHPKGVEHDGHPQEHEELPDEEENVIDDDKTEIYPSHVSESEKEGPVVTEAVTESGVTEPHPIVTEHAPESVKGEGSTEVPSVMTTFKPSQVITTKPFEVSEPEGTTRPSELPEAHVTVGETQEEPTEADQETVTEMKQPSIPEVTTGGMKDLTTPESVTQGVVTGEEVTGKETTESSTGVPGGETEPPKEQDEVSVPEEATEKPEAEIPKVTERYGPTKETLEAVTVPQEHVTEEIDEHVPHFDGHAHEVEEEEATEHVPKEHGPTVSTEVPQKETETEQPTVTERMPEHETESEILATVTEMGVTEKRPESVSHVTEKTDQGQLPEHDETATEVSEGPDGTTDKVPSKEEEGKPSEHLPEEKPEVTTEHKQPSISEEPSVSEPSAPAVTTGPEHGVPEEGHVTEKTEGESSTSKSTETATEMEDKVTEQGPVISQEPSVTEKEGELTTQRYVPEGITSIPEHIPETEKDSTTKHPIYVPDGTTLPEELPEKEQAGTTPRYVPELPEMGASTPVHVPEKEGTTLAPTAEESTLSDEVPESTEKHAEHTTSHYVPSEGSTLVPEHVPEKEGAITTSSEGLAGVTEKESESSEAGVTEKQDESPIEGTTPVSKETPKTTRPFIYIPPVHELDEVPEQEETTERESEATSHTVHDYVPEGTTEMVSKPAQPEHEGITPSSEEVPEISATTAISEPEVPKVTISPVDQEGTEPVVTVTPISSEPEKVDKETEAPSYLPPKEEEIPVTESEGTDKEHATPAYDGMEHPEQEGSITEVPSHEGTQPPKETVTGEEHVTEGQKPATEIPSHEGTQATSMPEQEPVTEGKEPMTEVPSYQGTEAPKETIPEHDQVTEGQEAVTEGKEPATEIPSHEGTELPKATMSAEEQVTEGKQPATETPSHEGPITEVPSHEGTQPPKESATEKQEPVTEGKDLMTEIPSHEGPVTEVPSHEGTQPPKESLPEEEQVTKEHEVVTEEQEHVTEDEPIFIGTIPPEESVTKGQESVTEGKDLMTEIPLHESPVTKVPSYEGTQPPKESLPEEHDTEESVTKGKEPTVTEIPSQEGSVTERKESVTEIPSHEGPVTEVSLTEGTQPPKESLPEQVTEGHEVVTEGKEPVTEIPAHEETQPPKESLPGQEQVTEGHDVVTEGQERVTDVPTHEEMQPPKESLPGQEHITEEQERVTEVPSHEGTQPPKEQEPITEGVTIVTAQPSAESEGKPTELPPQKPAEESTEYVSSVSSEKPEVPTTMRVEEVTDKRPSIPGEGQEPVEGEKPEEAYTSPTLSSTTDLYTSGPNVDESTKKSIPGELSTSAPSTMLTSSTTQHPTHHDIPEEPDYQTHVDQEEEYDDDQNSFGPGTCRYGGKVYVSAQQIPRDDPCDFCFCFRSDIICLQQSCPPPIPHCHEEPIRGFCCPRYECPVSMATSVNITTTTTTTTTTLPPHFLSHAYKGRAHRSGCQIRGKAYNIGEEIKSASGPCLHCTCGGNGQMKCDPKACSPEPMLRQMIAAAESRRRR